MLVSLEEWYKRKRDYTVCSFNIKSNQMLATVTCNSLNPREQTVTETVVYHNELWVTGVYNRLSFNRDSRDQLSLREIRSSS